MGPLNTFLEPLNTVTCLNRRHSQHAQSDWVLIGFTELEHPICLLVNIRCNIRTMTLF